MQHLALANQRHQIQISSRQHDDAAEVGAALGAAKGVSQGRRAARAQASEASASPPAGDPVVYSKSFNDCMLSQTTSRKINNIIFGSMRQYRFFWTTHGLRIVFAVKILVSQIKTIEMEPIFLEHLLT